MNRMPIILDKLGKAEQLTEEANTLAKEFVQDKSIPLETRWEFFADNELGGQKSWLYHTKCLKDFNNTHGNVIESLYFYEDRGRREEIYFFDIVSNLVHDIGKIIKVSDKEAVMLTKEHVDEFKEELLANYISSCIMDW